MIILDTNVLSAVMQEKEDPMVVKWLDRQAWESVWTTAITVFEIRLGLSLLAKSKRREKLEKAFGLAMKDVLEGRVLPFDEDAAVAAGELAAGRQRRGITVDMRDTQIAGIALAKRGSLVTRNIRDFEGLSVRVVNPWEDS